ncbi:Uncharacterised protein [uncultured archaeon]|nr:Uncharacterised protein [uncultured archaeon]
MLWAVKLRASEQTFRHLDYVLGEKPDISSNPASSSEIVRFIPISNHSQPIWVRKLGTRIYAKEFHDLSLGFLGTIIQAMM